MTIKAIIIDDEEKGLNSLAYNIKEFCSSEIDLVFQTQKPEMGLKAINKLKPKIVFLDIQMPRMNGFELLQKISFKNFFLIFTTAHSKYGIRAIKASAFDYLLKPIDPIELRETTNRIVEIINKNLSPHFDFQYRLPSLNSLNEAVESNSYPKHVTLPFQDHFKMFDVHSIIYIEADVNYSSLSILDKGNFIVARTLKSFEEVLDDDIFFRIHKSYLVNRHFISEIIKKSNYELKLKNGIVLPIARRRAKKVFDKLNYN